MEIVIYQNEEFFLRMIFEALDYNQDGYLSEIDLFLTMKDIHNDVFVDVFTPDFVKITQFIIEKKKMKGTYDETAYNYASIMKRINKYKWRFQQRQQSQVNNDKNEEPRKSFFEFATTILEPKLGKQSHEVVENTLNANMKQ